MTLSNRRVLRACSVFLALLTLLPAAFAAGVSVTTYHNDNNRTGWNKSETSLTPANVNAASFGLQRTVTLDDQVDAQVLVVSGVNITGGPTPGVYDVAYVATENNTVYAIDIHTGAILLSPNFGAPVPKPLACPNNGPNVGINGTPVIDPVSGTLFVITYTNDGPTYRIHALDLGTLTDKVTPVVVTASHQLTDGTTFTFNAKYQRQRPGLLLSNGTVYAGFGSFCDFSPSKSRGWLLGWNATNLTPLGANQLLDQQATAPHSFFLSSIWMSGYAPATDELGNVFFITGNSDSSGTTYDSVNNLAESAVKVSADVTTVADFFTPKNQAALEAVDNDFGSGGFLVLPAQRGTTPHIGVALGKNGSLYLLNRDSMGGYNPTGSDRVLGTYTGGACWCGSSYYAAADGTGRVVTSGARTAKLWKLNLNPKPALALQATSASVGGGQEDGFFTSISSNGGTNPIVWAVNRPKSKTNNTVSLFAMDPNNKLATLYSAAAGSWPNTGGAANIVPTVANGLVFVATNKQVQIFGLTGTSRSKKK